MSRASRRRGAGIRLTRSGLPTTCGVKLPDGRECRAKAGPFGACDEHADPAKHPRISAVLGPDWFRACYLTWLREQGREPVIPEDTEAFLGWWGRYPTANGVQVPYSMDLYQLREWWLVWCRLTGRPVLYPFDLSLFVEWWRVT